MKEYNENNKNCFSNQKRDGKNVTHSLQWQYDDYDDDNDAGRSEQIHYFPYEKL